MRLAVGATHGRVIQQLLTESVLLGLTSGVAGLLLAFCGAEFLTRLKPPVDLPISLKLVPDIRVLGFTLVVVLVTVVLFGAAPAFRLSRTSLMPKLGRGSDSGSGRRSTKGQRLLLVTQVTVSFLLLVGAGLCVRSLLNAERLDPGVRHRERPQFFSFSHLERVHKSYDSHLLPAVIRASPILSRCAVREHGRISAPKLW